MVKETKECSHKAQADLSQGLGLVRHYYCPDCESHCYKNKQYTAKQWWNKYCTEGRQS